MVIVDRLSRSQVALFRHWMCFSVCVREQKNKVANDVRSKLKRPRALFDTLLRKPSGKEVVLPKEEGDQAPSRLPE